MRISVSRDGAELGEWAAAEVLSLYAEGKLLPTDSYWREGMSTWEPLQGLIKPPLPACTKAIPADKKATAKIVATPQSTSIPLSAYRGSGNRKDDPIELLVLPGISDEWQENEIIDAMFGTVGYDKEKNTWLFYEGSHGEPQNRDLCEMKVTLNDGTIKTVWFNLFFTRHERESKVTGVYWSPPGFFNNGNK